MTPNSAPSRTHSAHLLLPPQMELLTRAPDAALEFGGPTLRQLSPCCSIHTPSPRCSPSERRSTQATERLFRAHIFPVCLPAARTLGEAAWAGEGTRNRMERNLGSFSTLHGDADRGLRSQRLLLARASQVFAPPDSLPRLCSEASPAVPHLEPSRSH